MMKIENIINYKNQIYNNHKSFNRHVKLIYLKKIII